MGVEIRLPNITGTTEREQLLQLKSYLYQLSEQLQWAFDNINTTGGGGSSVVINQTVKGASSTTSDKENPTFNELRSLIVKTADVVESYYEEITSTLKSEYVAESDFGTYKEEVAKFKSETASSTTETFNKIATIEGEINAYRVTQGYIKTGTIVAELSADEAAKYGLTEGQGLVGIEIGQDLNDGGTKYARFASNRLSFYSQSGDEMAYISNEKLGIRKAEIEEELQLGGYVDYIDDNGGIVTKWVGGS